MKIDKKKILILSIGFLPNLGGVETHLRDLIDVLRKKNFKVVVLTYQPLQTPVLGKWIEREKGLTIFRLPLIRGLFYKLLNKPILEFLFLAPLLFLVTPLILLFNPEISVINAQGIISGVSGAFWARIFGKRYVIATQHVYIFPKKGLHRSLAKWIFKSADEVLAISNQSAAGVHELGIPEKKIKVFTHWEDTNVLKPVANAKQILKMENEFIVSFFGRLVKEKGVVVLLSALKNCNGKITFLIYGEGPLKNRVVSFSRKFNNLIYMGTVTPEKLALHYSASDLVVMPSLHKEGFGRVAAGALLCGTPVIASDRGALPEVVVERVGFITKPTPKDLAGLINRIYGNKKLLILRKRLARSYAIRRFSKKNAEVIMSAFLG